jgi:hypothetical protein
LLRGRLVGYFLSPDRYEGCRNDAQWALVLTVVLPVTTMFVAGLSGLNPAAADPGLPDFCTGTDILQAEDPPVLISITGCDLTGRTIQDHGIGAIVPPAGKGVYAEGYGELNTQSLDIAHEESGDVRLTFVGDDRLLDLSGDTEPGDAQEAGPAGTGSFAPECLQDDGARLDYKESDDLKWFINTSTIPSGLSETAVRSALIAAENHLEQGYTDCDSTVSPGNSPSGAQGTYSGTTTAVANYDGDNCTGDDGVNTISFRRDSDGTWVAVNCAWRFLDYFEEVTETDNVFNTRYAFTTNPSVLAGCSGAYDIEAVHTHERGHTFGLGHVSETYAGGQTMSTNINGTCQDSERTLGRGDLLTLYSITY